MAQRDFDNFKADVDALAEQILFDTAEAVLAYINSSDIIPIDTHNLKDSTGVGVYRNGVLRQFTMSRRAERARIINDVPIWGEDMIEQLLNTGMTKYSNGDYIVMMSTMPYAEDVDDSSKYKGFFTDLLTDEFIGILDEIIAKYGVKRS